MSAQTRRRAFAMRLLGLASAVALTGRDVHAHGYRAGAIEVDHPYALPTAPGARHGAVYLRAVVNRGDRADRLVAATTPAARAVEIHRSGVGADGVVRMREVDGIDLPPRTEVRLRHGGDWHLMLVDLRAPLEDGDRFPLTLRFAHAGEREVTVWVQRPRAGGGADHRH